MATPQHYSDSDIDMASTPAASVTNPQTPGSVDPSLHFPTSSPARSALGSIANGFANGISSPLHMPDSTSPARTPRNPARRRAPSSGMRSDANTSNAGDGPLFFPSSASTARSRTIRGELGFNAVASSPLVNRRRFVPTGSDIEDDGMDGMDDGAMPRSDRALSQQTPTTDPAVAAVNDAEQKFIWGTYVSLGDSMAKFRQFLRGFKLKYRWEYQDANNIRRTYDASLNGETLVYESYLRRMRATDQTNLNLLIPDLRAFKPTRKLAQNVIRYPTETIPIMDQVLKDTMLDMAYDDARVGREGMEGERGNAEIENMEGKVFKVRPFGADVCNMRGLNPGDIDKLVTVKGLVIRATPVIPDMKQAFFRCLVCSNTVTAELEAGRIEEPTVCPRESCAQKGTMSLIHNRCEFIDKQVIRVQETPDSVPDGQTPHSVSMCAYDELVDTVKPGDRIEITGIFRSTPVRVNPRQRTQKSLFKTFLDVVHVKRGNAKRLGVDASTRGDEERAAERGAQAVGVGGEDDDFDSPTEGEAVAATGAVSPELLAKFEAIAGRYDVYDLLSRSLAPSIYEMEDVKKGILLQLFGGTHKSISRGGGGGGPRYRGDINVLMVGDPGTSKSQILMYVHKISPRGVYASGKGSSAVGLTAYVTRDPDTKQLVLESGALVLSDGGVCCIDEFDKMSDATRSVLHEVMEQQTVSIAKAGIITTLNARTSLLAAANPVGSKYNIKLPITRNIDLPPTLMSRFDLVYLVLDKIDEASDRRLARHLVGLYLEDTPDRARAGPRKSKNKSDAIARKARKAKARKDAGDSGSASSSEDDDENDFDDDEIIPIETLTAYISYARNHVAPQLTAEAGDALAREYVELRRGGEDARVAERRITATTRQLESMIRLSEAHARMRLSEVVEVSDVEEAVRLIREAQKSSATDPTTGLIDLDLINTGRGTHQRRLDSDLRRELLALLDEMGGSGGGAQRGAGAPQQSKAVRYVDLVRRLHDQSSVPIDSNEITEVVRGLEAEGIVKTAGDRERRTIRKVGDV